MVRPRRSVRVTLAAGVVAALGAGLLGVVPPPRARAAGEGDGMAAATTALEVEGTHGAAGTVGTSTLSVAVLAEPAEVVDGGSVTVHWTLNWSSEHGLPPVDRVAFEIPVPEAATLVHDLDAEPVSGVAAASARPAEGRLVLELTLDHTTDEVTALLTAALDLPPGLAPTVVGLATPDVVVLRDARSGGVDERCSVVDPVAALLEVRVVPTSASTATTSPSTSTPPTLPTTPTSTLPPATTTTRPWSQATTTTTAPSDPARGGDAPAAEPLAPADTPLLPTGAPPASRVVATDLDGARSAVAAARADLAAAETQRLALEQRAERLEARLRLVEEQVRALDRKLRHRARELGELLSATYVEAVDAEVTPYVRDAGAVSLATALDAARTTFERLLAREAELLARYGQEASLGAAGLDALGRVTDRADELRVAIREGRLAVATLRNGGGFVVTGFRFPVAGPHEFTDTWHAPRSGGRVHQGTDIFAAEGTPLGAVERGVVAGVGTDPLGGTKLWLVGESGTQYYYAHLRDYAPGVVDGLVVEAGERLGSVGHTGNARTTPSHLHFEVHPSGGPAVDAYPLLLAADGLGEGAAAG